MNMTSFNINYADTYFKYPTLKKIKGQPTYNRVNALKYQIKASLSSISSNIGGRAYGHLGLGFTAA